MCLIMLINLKKTVLHKAVQNNDLEIVKVLLNHESIDVNILQIKSIENWRTSSKDDSEDLSDVDCVYEVDDDGDNLETKPALLIALDKYKKDINLDIVKLLLSHPKIDVNIPKKSKYLTKTALRVAIAYSNFE